MTIYLRNENNDDILYCELWQEGDMDNKGLYLDLKCILEIGAYSGLLINNLDRKDEVIKDFVSLSNLRKWLWETVGAYFNGNKDYYEKIHGMLGEIFNEVANKYNLKYVED